MLKSKVFVCSDFRQNSRVIWDDQTKSAVVIDPGSKDAGIVEFLKSANLNLESIVLTHSHIDHYGGVKTVLDAFPGAPLFGHPGEKDFRKHFADRLALWGLPPDNYDECPEPTQLLTGGEKIQVLGREFEVIHTPGHSPGSLSFYCSTEHFVLSGDVLFKGSVGRTDLPGGNTEALKGSVSMLMRLPGGTKVLSGHGPETTIQDELERNMFVREMQ